MDRRGNRSQSETLGVVLILGITMLSVGLLAAYGGVAIDSVQHSVDVQSSEHALSQLDSKVSLVAFGEADRQTISLGRGRQGAYTVQPDAGRITVTHRNYSDNQSIELYNETMGAVRYETGETTIVYQGGGVWRSEGTGGSSMVSTPEFQYRGMTLTLPLIRVSGQGSISGSARADVQASGSPTKVYPDLDTPYPDGSRNYTNPVENGTVEITVQSEFYRAWGNYFEERTDGQVTTYDENETAVLELVSTGTFGDFDMPMDDGSIELRALGSGHPLTELTVTIAPDQPDSQEFTGLSWSMYAESGSEKFEIHLSTGGKASCNDSVSATVFYTDGTAHHGWHDDDAFEVSCDDVDGDGEGEARITANLTGSDSVQYGEVTKNEIMVFAPNEDLAEPATFDEHGATIEWEDSGGRTYDSGDTEALGNVTNHYVGKLGPNVDLNIKDGQGEGNDGSSDGNIDEESSFGYVDTEQTGQYVTFLHISENNVTVDLR